MAKRPKSIIKSSAGLDSSSQSVSQESSVRSQTEIKKHPRKRLFSVLQSSSSSSESSGSESESSGSESESGGSQQHSLSFEVASKSDALLQLPSSKSETDPNNFTLGNSLLCNSSFDAPRHHKECTCARCDPDHKKADKIWPVHQSIKEHFPTKVGRNGYSSKKKTPRQRGVVRMIWLKAPVGQTMPVRSHTPAVSHVRSAGLDPTQKTLFDCKPFYEVRPAPVTTPSSRFPRHIKKKELGKFKCTSLSQKSLFIDDQAESTEDDDDDDDDESEFLEEDSNFIAVDDDNATYESNNSEMEVDTIVNDDRDFIAVEEDHDVNKNLRCLLDEASGYQDSLDVTDKLQEQKSELLNTRIASKDAKVAFGRKILARDREKRKRGISLLEGGEKQKRGVSLLDYRYSQGSTVNALVAKCSFLTTPDDRSDDGYDSETSDRDRENDKPTGVFKTPEDERDDLEDPEYEKM